MDFGFRKILLGFIRAYQKSKVYTLPFLKTLWLSDKSCRYFPTCSTYCYQAIEKYGTLRGLFLCLKRVFRCHPWSKGGYDPLK